MKKKSFFYKFDKYRHVSKSSNHSFFSENEEKNSYKLASILAKEDALIEMIDGANERIESYYENRINFKREYLTSRPYLESFGDYLVQNKEYILNLHFWKILSIEEIERIYELFWSNVIRVSHYDTVIEVLSNNKETLFGSIKEAVKDEINIIKSVVESWEDYISNNRFILSIESIGADTINREKLDNIISTNNIIASFSKDFFSQKKEELEILKSIYQKHKNSNSKIKNISNEESRSINFIFNNVTDLFVEDIKLLDSLMNIEIIDTKEDLILQRIDFTISPPLTTEWIWTDLCKICVVELQKIKNNYYYGNRLFYGTSDSTEIGAHGTSVWLLAMYGKINNSTWDSLPSPDCTIYGISSKTIFRDLEEILNEAEANNCSIINISVGVEWYIQDNAEMSILGKKLDSLLENRNLLVILSWWNIKPIKRSYREFDSEDTNINIPKDSISSIAIGAKNDSSTMELYSRKNNINPEYEIGWTKGYMYRLKDKMKPDFIDFWENKVFDGVDWYLWHWTSYAAPLVANKAAKLLNVYNDISTNTIKWLFINYSNTESYRHSIYPSKSIFNRHVWRWDIDIKALIEDNDNYINIIIEDFIGNNEKKDYSLKFPQILEQNKDILIRRSISYNPPIAENYHLKYAKFCVSSKLWSDSYESKKKEFFETNDSVIANELFQEWKKEKIDYLYTRPLNWVNYFGTNNFWSANSSRENILNSDLYEELRNNTIISIEWHTRWGFIYKQKFSFVMTIDIRDLTDKRSFIEEFYSLNTNILINWENLTEISDNTNLKEQAFIDLNTNIEIDVESF